MFEKIALLVGWAGVIGILVLIAGAAWYHALKLIYGALKNSYYMVMFMRFMIIAIHRDRRKTREKVDAEWLQKQR